MIHNEQPRWWCPACWFLGHAPEPWPTEANVPTPAPGPFLGTLAYKIVRRLRADELWSYMAYITDDDDTFPYDRWQRRYFPGHTTRPVVGMLFVFDSLAHARQYKERNDRRQCEIWEADIQGAERLTAASYTHPEAFWDDGVRTLITLPKGTLVCNTVTLRQRVA